jgi:hypothetical protein
MLELPKFNSFEGIKTGDMPGDKIEISDMHINHVKTLSKKLDQFLTSEKLVISVYGGSGVGKSETASLLGEVLRFNGYRNYILSGDNYPRRIPSVNDSERIRVFREAGLKGLIKEGLYSEEIQKQLSELINNDFDSNPDKIPNFPFLNTYINNGKAALRNYLGTPNETDFDEVNRIISQFKSGQSSIYLKRMGRSEEEIWYDLVEFSNVNILIIEWTHGNNQNLKGVDVPIFLNSTPEETLHHRLKRNRDGKIDSPFVKLVLDIEQSLLVSQAINAKMIVSKQSELLSYNEYNHLMGLNNE